MKERVILERLPHKSVIEEFLEGLEGQPTVIYNRENRRFERVNNPNQLCPWCGKSMEPKGTMDYCGDCHLWMPRK